MTDGSSNPAQAVDRRSLIERLYVAFNGRELDDVLAYLHPQVDWPNGWEGGRLAGRDAVRDYWLRQWAAIDPHVEPLAIVEAADGRVSVRVRQVVRDLGGATLFDGEVEHVYTFDAGLIRTMDIR